LDNSKPASFKNVYVETFGCSSNYADGEFIAGCLQDSGYRIVDDPADADILIYNTCAVKAPTENRMISILKRVTPRKKLIVAGCLPLVNLDRLTKEVRFDGVIGPSPGSEIVGLVRRLERGERVILLGHNSKPSLSLPRLASSRVRRIIPISYGCVSACSFCAVRLARGKLRSYSVEEVEQQIKKALTEGVSEIWLTGQDVSCYGWDIGIDLVALLRRISNLEYRFFLRLGMMHPTHALRMLEGLIEVFKVEKVFKFLHLPVQSGDDEVIRLMNRGHTVEDFKKVLSSLRHEIPRLTLATDIICGFPNESEEAFERSMKLIEEVKPDVVNVSKFCPRPGTQAEKMQQLPSQEIKDRTRRMSELAKRVSYEKNSGWLGWRGEILVDEEGRDDSWVGRNFAYKPIVVRGERRLLGEYLNVEVTNTFPTYLEARVK